MRGFSAVVELLLLSCCLSLFAFREDSSGKDEKDAANDMERESFIHPDHPHSNPLLFSLPNSTLTLSNTSSSTSPAA